MKKILTYAIILVPIFLVWLHWGGFKNDMGTLILAMVATFACTVATDKMHEKETQNK